MSDPKILLMPLGTGNQAQERLNCALMIAKSFQAHLRVLHTGVDPHSIMPQEEFLLSPETRKDVHEAYEQHANAEAQPLQDLFAAACQAQAVPIVDSLTSDGPSASWQEEQGLRSALVTEYGKVADLTLLARPPEGKATAAFEAAALETGRPVLVVPRKLDAFHLDTVTVAWNCTVEASRSLADALPFLQRAGKVIVTSADECMERKPTPTEVCQYLKVHGVQAETEILKRGKGKKGEALLASARTNQSNLVVLGAYSKSRFQESMFGGVTQYMLANAEMPLLFSH